MLEAVLNRIVPDDGNGAGAAELGLLEFIRARLSGPRAASVAVYVAGLADVDRRTHERYGHGVADACPAEQDDILSSIESEEAALPPWSRGAAFLETVLRDVREGMFGDPAYGGNRDGRGWDLLGYPDPRSVWTEADQRMDVVIIPLHPRLARPPRKVLP